MGQLVDFRAGSSGARGAKRECVLHGVHIFHGLLESCGRLHFTGLQDVGHLLPVGVEAHVGDAEVEMDHVARLKDVGPFRVTEVTALALQRQALMLNAEVRREPGGDVVLPHLVVEPVDGFSHGGFSGGDGFVREAALGDQVREDNHLLVRLEFFGQARLEILSD
jgi:hypothetical protein